MNNQEINYQEPEEELEASSPFEFPNKLKWFVTVSSLIIISTCIYLVINYIDCPKINASPKKLGLSSVFLFSLTALLLVWFPWQQLGMRITKIGGVEFKEIVTEQASEHAEEVTFLQDRIEVLESKVHQLDEMSEFTESFEEPKLRELLFSFLTKYSKWAFSPSRIRAWGAQQQDYSSLLNYGYPFIRSTLQKMVSENMLETRVSKKGNTLYRVSQP